MLFRSAALFVFFVLLAGCQSIPESRQSAGTLAELDADNPIDDQGVVQKKVDKEEIRRAYTEYLDNASVDEKSRLNALTRLAELEYEQGNELDTDGEQDQPNQQTSAQNERFYRRLQRTIDLLSTSIRDYPDAEDNDLVLYQLAKAQAQNNQHDESIESLTLLAEKYPASRYYVEAQFRIAEDAFSVQDYSTAEYSYSEVLLSPDNEIFLEKSIFKRGWARFKQEYYEDAIEDFVDAILINNIDDYESLNTTDRNEFDEYIRAIALAFTYLEDSDSLARYLRTRQEFTFVYSVYQKITDLYLAQERYSDAVEVQQQFIRHFADSESIPYAYLRKIEIWKDSGFNQPIYDAIEEFYANFNPDSEYWTNQNENSKVNRTVRRSLREYVVLITGYFHSRYQASRANADYRLAENWYRRYLKYYDAYARQDNMFFLYGELLSEGNRFQDALAYYEQAAFDNEQILHKEAAYASIVLTNQLFATANDKGFLNRYITYTRHFCRQFPSDKRGEEISNHAAEQAFLNARYSDAIELSDLALENYQSASSSQARQIKATSYYRLNEFETAEKLYTQLLSAGGLNQAQVRQFRNDLALSIYRQGEASVRDNDTARAIHHFARISTIAASSEVASTGLYDAIALNMEHQQWPEAIDLIQRFQKLYPRHKYSVDVSKKLSAAYLSSDQGIKAAQEFEKIARVDNDLAVKAAAQWKAAELYEQEGNVQSAIQAYQTYSKTFHQPYERRLAAMNKVAELLSGIGSAKAGRQWHDRIVKLDSRVLNNVRTDSSRFITSSAYLSLARFQKERFDGLQLTLPLKRSLRMKKSAMQEAVQLFGKASLNKIYDITTEATYSIGKIYRDFSQALLDSDRPSNLNDEELDQYEILLEDQAFPFEDKSIEFFEINLARVADGLYNDWIAKSLVELKGLFPVRYDRKPKLDLFVTSME